MLIYIISFLKSIYYTTDQICFYILASIFCNCTSKMDRKADRYMPRSAKFHLRRVVSHSKTLIPLTPQGKVMPYFRPPPYLLQRTLPLRSRLQLRMVRNERRKQGCIVWLSYICYEHGSTSSTKKIWFIACLFGLMYLYYMLLLFTVIG